MMYRRFFLLFGTYLCLSACSSSENVQTYKTQVNKPQISSYLVADSTILMMPLDTGSSILTCYSASVIYNVKNIESAELQLKAILNRLSLKLTNRYERLSGNEFIKDFSYTMKSSDFTRLEKSLDSLFGRAMNKNVSIETCNKGEITETLRNRIASLRKNIDRYNNHLYNREFEGFEKLIKEDENSISNLKWQLINCNKNESTIRISFKENLKKSDVQYVEPGKKFNNW